MYSQFKALRSGIKTIRQKIIQVFEVEDPQGPLETLGEDIGQRFGRLQVKSAAELGLPPGQLHELAAAQSDPPQPTLEQDLEVWKHHVGISQQHGETHISVHTLYRVHVHILAASFASSKRRMQATG